MPNETLKLINGNKQVMVKELPKIVVLGYLNEGGLEHITENTGLRFTPTTGGYEVQPTSSNQIVRLFLTYNFKTRYFDNADSKNTLYLKHDHHIGFQVDSICFNCVKHNHIVTNGLNEADRLAC